MSNDAADSRWDELDLLRGIAGVLMVTNHTGYKWLGAGTLADPLVSALVFAGSCAPVVFFTTTGIGYGLQVGRRRPADPRGLMRKVVLLLIADALMWLSLEQRIGLDFLGFIGLSMLVLDPLRRARRAVLIAMLGIGVVTVLRYGVGEAVKSWPGAIGEALRAALGVEAIAGVSYPPLPWLAYPLTGFVLGAVARRARPFLERRFLAVVAAALVTAAGCIAATRVLVHTGRAIHRWGYVSLAFYAVSFAAIATAVVFALLLGRFGGALARRLFELRGVASLALVPLHYALIVAAAALVDLTALDRFTWLVATVAMIVASFAASRYTESVAATLGAIAQRGGHIGRALAIGVVLAIALKLVLMDMHPLAAFSAAVIGQVLLCLLFAMPRASPPAV